MHASSMVRGLAAAMASGVLLLATSCGIATAGPIGPIYDFAVGNGSGCTHGTLQAAIDAAAAAPGPHTVVVTASAVYADQALSINDAEALTLAGGYADCFATETAGTTTIDGSASASVVRINGAGALTLQGLTISGGNSASSSFGGGIRHQGGGLLLVRDSIVRDNIAALGGGIAVAGTGSLTIVDSEVLGNAVTSAGGGLYRIGSGDVIIERSAVAGNSADGVNGGAGAGVYFEGPGLLRIADGTIEDNSATGQSQANGGGVAVVADVEQERPRLELLGATHIRGNHAANAGGGLYLRNVDLVADLGGSLSIEANHADGIFGGGGGGLFLSGGSSRIGSGKPGALFLDNTARHGGGGLLATDGADLHIFATDPMTPPAFIGNRGNSADDPNSVASGGALLADTESGFNPQDDGTIVLLYDVELRGNAAPIGGAVAVNGYSPDKPTVLCLGRASEPASCAPHAAAPPANVVVCDARAACNRVSDNTASFHGAAFGRIGAGGALRIGGARIHGHDGNSLLFSTYTSFSPEGEEVVLRDCLIEGNNSFGALFAGFNHPSLADLQYYLGHVRVERCTIADNTIAGASVFGSRAALVLRESIVWQPGLPVHAGHAGGIDARHVLAHEIASLPLRADVVAGDPLFIDPANGDFRLDAGSPALDFSNLDIGGFDLDGEPRGHDTPDVANRFGPRDLGAYERGPTVLFEDGFEQP